MSKWLVLCPAVLSLVLGSTRAVATGVEAPLEQTLTGGAADAYSSAKLLFNNSDFPHAELKYQQAYDLSKDPRLLFDMAICEKNQHSYARMERLLLQYKAEMGDKMSAEDGAVVDGALEAVKKLVGTVSVTVNEPGAAVSADGTPVGVAPLASALVLDLGTHTVLVKKPGFADESRQVDVTGGNSSELTIALKSTSKPGHLIVATDSGAAISVDGRVTGAGRFDANLATGAHTLHVSAEHKKPYDTTVALHDGETRTLEVTLEDEQSKKPVWEWIVGGAVVAAGAAVGGYFLFKPHDDTTPIPQGKLTTVNFSLSR